MSDTPREQREQRPSPDAILERLRKEELEAGRGKLRLFFGFAPGVGKTMRMLEVAHALVAKGKDVVVGVVETHGRADTAARLVGLEAVPLREVVYREKPLHELDLDSIKKRAPDVVLVDELAHTNAPGSLHTKRWQDVLDLLAAGIDVFTTLNVQHVESLNDVVAQVTHVTVRETVPDSVIERADEVELVDVSPDELLARLAQGKVYVPEQALVAAKSFFRRGNLLALRELALRRTADRVDVDVRAFREANAVQATWPAKDLVLVCVSAAPASARLVRAGKRIADGIRAPWLCAYVESPDTKATGANAERLDGHLALAEALGAEVVKLGGTRPSEAILAYARKRNVTRIIVGKPTHPRVLDLVRGSFLDSIVRGSGDIDVLVLRGTEDEKETTRPERAPRSAPAIDPKPYGLAILLVGVATAFAYVAKTVLLIPDVEMVYFVAIVLAAVRLGRGPSVLAAALSVAAFDFFFVPPYFTFEVADSRYGLTFGMMFVVGLVIGSLTMRVRAQESFARMREERTAALYSASRKLSAAEGQTALALVAAQQAVVVTGGAAVVLLARREGRLAPIASWPPTAELDAESLGAAEWAYVHGRKAGLGTGTLPGAKVLALPMTERQKGLGVLVTVPREKEALDAADRAYLETLAGQLGAAIDRADLRQKADEATLVARTEELRSSLLSAVSHDLRTPLGAITGAATVLRDEPSLSAESKRELVVSVCDEAERLERMVGNLLEMTRLESGKLEPRRDWVMVEELVGSAVTRLEKRLEGRRVSTHIAPDVGFLSVDPVLFEQVLLNLVENALKYTPKGTAIEIDATRKGDDVTLVVRDHGPGFPEADGERIFEKFYRGNHVGIRGVGLGLAICRAIVTAHGGTLVAKNEAPPDTGASMRIVFPSPILEPDPASLDGRDDAEAGAA